MGEKSGLAKLDVWGVEDQAAAKKEKEDPAKLKLRPLDEAMTFMQNNAGDEEFVDVKTGWVPRRHHHRGEARDHRVGT